MQSRPPLPADDEVSFHDFARLPGELQAHILSFVPVRALVCDVAPVSRSLKALIDACIASRLSNILRLSTTLDGKPEQHVSLLFEARRPIDTLTTRHRLYLSHVGYDDETSEHQTVAALRAHFHFVAPHKQKPEAETAAPLPLYDSYDGQSSLRGRRTSQWPTSMWSEPVTSSLAVMEASQEYGDSPERDQATTSRRQASRARREAHYAAAGRAEEGARGGTGAPRAAPPPTYRFQLDELDSFETWILSLSMQRLWRIPQPSSPVMSARWSERDTARAALSSTNETQTAFPALRLRPVRMEKRVVEGLDRVFRHWFKPTWRASGLVADRSASTSREAAATRTEANSDSSSASSPSSDSLSFSWTSRIPDERELEMNGRACAVRIQPHINERAECHPALVNISSHYYLSSPSYAQSHSQQVRAATASATAESDFTFHCTHLRLNAALLLSVIEDMDDQVDGLDLR